MGPDSNCDRCPRLAAFRTANRVAFPDWHNAPVPTFRESSGESAARLLIVGLAPGLRGANRTGRPFTGDFAGDLLYATLLKHGLAEGTYGADPHDGIRLRGCRLTNAVRCVPPENKPVGAEIAACLPFLTAEIDSMPELTTILALGTIAHGAVLAASGLRKSAFRFAHGAFHALPGGRTLADSYHCSRYNTSTRRLTPAMFDTVVEAVAARL